MRSRSGAEVDDRRTVRAVGDERCLRIGVSEVLAVRGRAEVAELAVAEGQEDRSSRGERARHLAIDRDAGLGLQRQGGADGRARIEERRPYAERECEGVLALGSVAIAVASAVAKLNVEERRSAVAEQSRADETLFGDEKTAAHDSGLSLRRATAGAAAASRASSASCTASVPTRAGIAGSVPAATARRDQQTCARRRRSQQRSAEIHTTDFGNARRCALSRCTADRYIATEPSGPCNAVRSPAAAGKYLGT